MESLRAPGAASRRLISLSLLLCAFAAASDPTPLAPLTVCEVLADLPAHDGKNYAVLGRYSYRRDGRWIGEDACGSAPGMLSLNEDTSAPRPPGEFDLDAAVLNKKFADMVKHTVLGKFKFGNPEYDRWAVVFGRVEARKPDDHGHKTAADLVFRGSGVVIFLTTER